MGREWLGLVVLQRFFERFQEARVEDVHRVSQEFDLVYQVPGDARRHTIDVKVDFYFGQEDRSEFHRRRTGFLALETVSNDVSGTMGWMVTSPADFICYYFMALNNHAEELKGWYETGDADACLGGLSSWDDCLLVLPVPALKAWFWGDKRYLSYRHARIPNVDREGKVYHTWVRLVPVEAVASLPGVRIYNRLVDALRG